MFKTEAIVAISTPLEAFCSCPIYLSITMYFSLFDCQLHLSMVIDHLLFIYCSFCGTWPNGSHGCLFCHIWKLSSHWNLHWFCYVRKAFSLFIQYSELCWIDLCVWWWGRLWRFDDSCHVYLIIVTIAICFGFVSRKYGGSEWIKLIK